MLSTNSGVTLYSSKIEFSNQQKLNMYNNETIILLLMLDIPEQQYSDTLYGLAEKWEDRQGLSGMYTHKEFRNWWKLRANVLGRVFFDQINYTKKNQLTLNLRDDNGCDHFYTGKEEIRRQFFTHLRRLVTTPFDYALHQIINQRVKQA